MPGVLRRKIGDEKTVAGEGQETSRIEPAINVSLKSQRLLRDAVCFQRRTLHNMRDNELSNSCDRILMETQPIKFAGIITNDG